MLTLFLRCASSSQPIMIKLWRWSCLTKTKRSIPKPECVLHEVLLRCVHLWADLLKTAQTLGSSGVRPCLSAIFLEAPALQTTTWVWGSNIRIKVHGLHGYPMLGHPCIRTRTHSQTLWLTTPQPIWLLQRLSPMPCHFFLDIINREKSSIKMWVWTFLSRSHHWFSVCLEKTTHNQVQHL